MMVAAAPAARSAAVERMRQHRERRRQGLRCLMIELHVTEIDAIVGLGLLKAEMRDDPGEVSVTLYEHLNRTLGAGCDAKLRNEDLKLLRPSVVLSRHT